MNQVLATGPPLPEVRLAKPSRLYCKYILLQNMTHVTAARLACGAVRRGSAFFMRTHEGRSPSYCTLGLVTPSELATFDYFFVSLFPTRRANRFWRGNSRATIINSTWCHHCETRAGPENRSVRMRGLPASNDGIDCHKRFLSGGIPCLPSLFCSSGFSP